jgi:hypothetical protein
MAGAAEDAASSVLGKVKHYFPNSPAKKGPFSGSGWTHYSGRAVMRDWAGGMLAEQDAVTAAVATVAGSASAGLGMGAGAGIGTGAGSAGARSATAGRRQ